MLRLERASKSGEIHVQLRTKERFFNSTLCLALGIAAFMHLLAIVFFHVKPFKVESQWVIPAVRVNSEVGAKVEEGDAFVLAQIEEGKQLTPSFKAPPRSRLVLPGLPDSYAALPLTLTEETTSEMTVRDKDPSPLQEILPLKQAPLPRSVSYDSFEIALSGRLADKEVLKKMVPDQITSSVAGLSRFRSRHLVRIDEKTGMIFWHKPLELTKNTILDRKASQILASLRFKPDPQMIDTEGEIEITFVIP